MKSKNIKKSVKNFILTAGGLLVGFLNGFFGGGGGMIAVPVLSSCGIEAKKSHASALMVILPLSAVSAFFYLKGGSVEPPLLLKTGAGVILGGILGAFLLKKLSGSTIRIVFIAVMLAAGIRLCF